MQKSEHLDRCLEKTKSRLLEMQTAASLADLEEAWTSLVHDLDRLWNKAHSHYGKSPKWSGWVGRFTAVRRKDSLLSYLMHARNTDEHTVSPITERTGGSVVSNPKDRSRPMFIKSAVITSNSIKIEGDNIVTTFRPGRVALLPVVDREGRAHAVPTQHLGAPMDPSNVLEAARLAVSWYARLIAEAEEFFCGPSLGR